MVDDSSPRRTPGRQRRYASNAERQAAYRERSRARQAAALAIAGGDPAAAEQFVELLLRAKVAGLEADRARFKEERDRAEHELSLARPRLERSARLLTEAQSERDEARRSAAAARTALRQAKAESEREARQLWWMISDLRRELERARRTSAQFPDVEPNAAPSSPTSPVIATEVPPETVALNRARRRALLRRQPPR